MITNVASSTQFTIGKIDAGLAILLSPDNDVVEFPSSILPTNVTVGSIVNVKIESNQQAEQQERQEFDNLQLEIYENYIQTPVEPVLEIVRVGQADVLIGWKKLDYKATTLIRLDIYKNQVLFKSCENTGRLKITGLELNSTYQFHMVMVTKAGNYKSNTLDVRTKTMEDLSSLYPSFGAFRFQDLILVTRQTSIHCKNCWREWGPAGVMTSHQKTLIWYVQFQRDQNMNGPWS